MKRVIVVGPPGSGKSTTGRRIGERLGLRHTELDSIWWEPDWVEAGPDVFRRRLAQVAAPEEWVIDGNYFSVGAEAIAWPRADTVVWLDLPRWTTFVRVARRSLRHVVTREVLWAGNRETWQAVLRPGSIVVFAWKSHAKYGQRYEPLIGDPFTAHLRWVRLRTPREVRRFLRNLV